MLDKENKDIDFIKKVYERTVQAGIEFFHEKEVFIPIR